MPNDNIKVLSYFLIRHTISQVLIAWSFWLQIARFSINCNQKNGGKKNMQWMLLHVTMSLLLKRSTRVFISTVRYNRIELKSKVNLPTPSHVQLSPNILREVNQAVTAMLECDKAGNQAKRSKKKKYNTSFTPEYCAAVGWYTAVACPLSNLQSLQSQSGLFSIIRNRLDTYSKPNLE